MLHIIKVECWLLSMRCSLFVVVDETLVKVHGSSQASTLIFMRLSLHYLMNHCSFVSEYSMQLNASRIKVLQAQDDLVNKMKEDAMKELLNISSNHHEYRNLLKELVVQVCLSVPNTNLFLISKYCWLTHIITLLFYRIIYRACFGWKSQLYCSAAAKKITIMWNLYCIQQRMSMHQKQMSMSPRY